MKKIAFLLTLFCFAIVLSYACSRKEPEKPVVSRAQLVDLMDQYLEALVKHDPSAVPLASNVRLVENTKVSPIGKGLWETSTGSGTTEYKIHVADPVMGQVGYMGLIEDKGKPVQLGVHLKLENGEITEIDHMVWQIDGPLPDGLIKPRPGLVQKLDESERVSREEMFKAANAWWKKWISIWRVWQRTTLPAFRWPTM